MAGETNVEVPTEKAAQSVVVSDSTSSGLRKLLPHRKEAIIAIVVALVVVVAVCIVVLQMHKSSKPSDSPYQQQLTSELQRAQAKVSKDKTAAPAQKAKDYANLGMAYMNVDQPSEGVKAFQKALDADPASKRQTLSGLMYAYAANGQRQEAIATGEELLAILKQQAQNGDPTQKSEIEGITNDLETLKAGKNL